MKSETYGFLNNTRVYDVDTNDAKLWIKKGFAMQLDLDLTIEEVRIQDKEDIKKLTCSKEELKLKGLRQKKKKLKKRSIQKKNMIKANARSKAEEKASIRDIVEPMLKEVSEIDEKIKKTEEKLNKEG